MNVLNVHEVERELTRYAARMIHADAQRWVMSVARNHFLSRLPEKEVSANFRLVTTTSSKPAYHKVKAENLPPWALPAVEAGTLLWFDTIQPGRRDFWKVLEIIGFWLNHWKAADPRLRRIDRISFPVATDAAVLWHKDVSENIWNYITDKPVVVKEYDAFRWVKLVTALQFEREGSLMNHCVGNGSYFNRWRNRETEYYSLRDARNKPHVTMEIGFNSSHPLMRQGHIQQCKGKNNSKPDKEYQVYIRRLLTDFGLTVIGDSSFID